MSALREQKRLDKHEEAKATKEAAGYMKAPEHLYAPEGKGIRCGNCMYFGRGGACGIVQGTVHEQGCCNLFDIEDIQVHPWKFASGPAMEKMREGIVKIHY